MRTGHGATDMADELDRLSASVDSALASLEAIQKRFAHNYRQPEIAWHRFNRTYTLLKQAAYQVKLGQIAACEGGE